MDDDGDWITARYLLASILGRDPMVVDYVDEESFPVDPPPARLAEAPVPAPAVSVLPAVRAPEGVAGTVCLVCTEETAAADAMVRLPCAHCDTSGVSTLKYNHCTTFFLNLKDRGEQLI
jgi:hypothetical protein